MDFQPWLIGIFLFLIGTCVGSFLNVVIWRLPRHGTQTQFAGRTGALTLSWPSSHCPVCHSCIPWYCNVPIMSWLVLGARCNVCRTPISARYPMVELSVGLLFPALYLAYFFGGWGGGGFIFPFQGALTLISYIIYVVVLLAASGIDVDWFEIPLVLPGLLIAVALAACLAGFSPTLPLLSTDVLAAKLTVGATVGLFVSNILLQAKIFPRSFPMPSYPIHAPSRPISPPPAPAHPAWVLLACGLVLILVIGAWMHYGLKIAALAMLAGGVLIFLIGVLPRGAAVDFAEQVLEETRIISARREILKELLFLLPIFFFAAVWVFLPLHLPESPIVERLLGVLFGMLCGAGLVWIIRIVFTLVLGRVAMGLGDIFLMAGIGAVIGMPLVIVVFFLAVFLAVLWAVVIIILGRPNVLPFGPWLGAAGILALLVGAPIANWYVQRLFPQPF